jgi:hypothetical protein
VEAVLGGCLSGDGLMRVKGRGRVEEWLAEQLLASVVSVVLL